MGSEKLRDVMGYLCSGYPYPDELSKARLTKLVYLADWRMSIISHHQITDIEWLYNHYGPYVDAVSDLARTSPDFSLAADRNAFGAPREVISFIGEPTYPTLSEVEFAVLDHVIETTQTLNFADFLNLVYSTYPIQISPRYARLDLAKLAEAYEQSDEGASEIVGESSVSA